MNALNSPALASLVSSIRDEILEARYSHGLIALRLKVPLAWVEQIARELDAVTVENDYID